MDKNDPRRAPSDEELDDLNEHWHEPGDPDGVVAAEQEREWRKAHPAPAPAKKRKPKKRHGFLKFLLVIILLVAATLGANWLGNHEASKGDKPAKTTTTQKKAPAKPAVTPTKHYISTNFGLELDYLSTWKLVDTPTKLTVTSPAMSLTAANGQKKQLHVQVTVQNKQTTIPGFPTGGATESIESQKLTYVHPTPVQRAQTYISLLGYTSETQLNAIFVTGDSGYVQKQYVPMSDVVASNPLISVQFVNCTSADCSTGTVTPTALEASSWQGSDADKAAVNLLQSLVFDS